LILEARPNPANHWVGITLEGSPKNRLGLNAIVRVTAGALTQTGEVRSGGSYLSQNDLRLHFGLAGAGTIDKLTVLWPKGEQQEFRALKADRFYRVKQATGLSEMEFSPK